MCGKDYKALSVPINCPGSPPLAREGRAVTICIIPLSRITPACVGRTQRCPNLVLLRQDHPRVCGNDCVVTSHGFKGRGSPPLAREGPIEFCDNIHRIRITPARAGRTIIICLLLLVLGDHPRSRGKDLSTLSVAAAALGSPPLAREGQNTNMYFHCCFRITPARAGRTEC